MELPRAHIRAPTRRRARVHGHATLQWSRTRTGPVPAL